MLEPYEGKLSRTVLRGERGREAPTHSVDNNEHFDNSGNFDRKYDVFRYRENIISVNKASS